MTKFQGSTWGVWDLQIQTILDDRYKELKDYYKELKASKPEQWAAFIKTVGNEQDAILFDSKDYFFTQSKPSVKNRCENYSRNLFNFLQAFAPDLKCIGVTDHNHIHEELMNSLVRVSKDYECKVLPGVEINVGGVHLLIYFPHPPCEKDNYSEGIKTFLGTLEIFNSKGANGALSLAKGDPREVIEKIKKQHGLFIFAHCNSDNGLFQERGKTDRSHLAEVYNCSNPVILQCHTKKKSDDLAVEIRKRPTLTSVPIFTIASDGRSLKSFGSPDLDGNHCFIKGAPTVEGLRQAIYEPETRLRLASSIPIPPIHRIGKIALRFPESSKLSDDTFCFSGVHELSLSPNYTCLIGGRGSGKSTLLNLIQEKVNPRSNLFFSARKILSPEGKMLNIPEFVSIDDDDDKKVIDFLSQNEIEKFATNAHALTSALYSRLEKENHGKLKKAQDTLNQELIKTQSYIDDHKRLNELAQAKSSLEKELQSQEKILKSFQSKQYIELAEKVAGDSEAFRSFQTSKLRFNRISLDIEKLLPKKPAKTEQTSVRENEYEDAYNQIVVLLEEAKNISSSLDGKKLLKKESALEKKLEDSKANLSDYLSEKGLTPDSQQDVADANENISRLKVEIEDHAEAIGGLTVEMENYATDDLRKSKEAYETTLIGQIRIANSKLENLAVPPAIRKS